MMDGFDDVADVWGPEGTNGRHMQMGGAHANGRGGA